MDAATVEIGRLLAASRPKYESLFQPIAGQFTACVVLLPESQFRDCGVLFERIGHLLASGAQISIVALNERPASVAGKFVQTFALHSSNFFALSAWIADAQYVPASRARWTIYRAMRWFSDHARRSRWTSPIMLGAPVGVAVLSVLSCLTSLRAKATRSPPRLASSILVQLRLSTRGAGRNWTAPSQSRIGHATAEPEPVGAASRGNYSADLAAKYGFVSGIVARRFDVAAYGCIDDFGPQLVLEKVKKLSVYDPDPRRIEEISQKIFDPWKFEAQVHDILDKPLPAVHDAIYNLDTLEYVSPSDEDRYLLNLSRSLSRHQDILIIGLTPCDADDDTATEDGPLSLQVDRDMGADRRPLGLRETESSARSPIAPESRPRYRRTSAGVRALLEHHFRTVSLFSLTAGVVQTGTSETGDYLFALCSSKKD